MRKPIARPPVLLVTLVCAACGTSESSDTGARHDGGPDAYASGGANTAGSGGGGNRMSSGGAGNRAGSGGSGNGPASGGTAGLDTGGASMVDGGSTGGNGGAQPSDAGDSGGGDCASAIEQRPCSAPGTSCGGPCTDPCVFCNLLVCNGGVWQRVEAAPAPCFDCGTRRCQVSATFCSVIHASTDSFECLPVPAGCERDVTCACIEPKVSAESCTSTAQGEVTVERSGG